MPSHKDRTHPNIATNAATLPLAESIEALIGVPQERQLHLRAVLLAMTSSLRSLNNSALLCLTNLVNWEVSSIRGRLKSRLKRRTNTSQSIKVDTMEKGMSLDFISTTTSKTVLCVDNQTTDKILSLSTKLDVVWEMKGLAPVDDLAVGVMLVLGAERGPSDLALEHNRAQGPPIAVEGVTGAGEDLWCDVVWSSDGGVGHDAARFTPVVDDSAVADGQVDLVEVDRHAVPSLVCWLSRLGEKLSVIGVVMHLVETCRQSEIGQLDVSATIKQDVVRLNVTASG